jgi:hypothetical protein
MVGNGLVLFSPLPKARLIARYLAFGLNDSSRPVLLARRRWNIDKAREDYYT